MSTVDLLVGAPTLGETGRGVILAVMELKHGVWSPRMVAQGISPLGQHWPETKV